MDATVAVVVRDRKYLESKEHDYEQVSAVVYDRKHMSDLVWYKLRYSDGKNEMFAWLSQADAGRFRMYGDLVHHKGLTYFTDNWDKRLYQRPDMSAPFTRFEELGEHPDIRVADARYGKDLWLLIVIVNGSICGDRGDGGTTVIATGWVPAYAQNGSETVWYYSRGC